MEHILYLAALAFPAGVLGFAAAPCCGLLTPVYLPYITGQQDSAAHAVASGTDGITLMRRWSIRHSVFLFVAGFTVFFTLLGASASAVGALLLTQLPLLETVAGIFMIAMGVALLGRINFLLPRSNKCINLSGVCATPFGAVGMGVTFAIAWTPCTGPVLGSVLAAAATAETVWQGTGLLFIYSLGLALPFIMMAFALGASTKVLAFQRKYARVLECAGGVIMISVGILIMNGGWQAWLGPLTRWLVYRGWPPL